MLSGRYFHNIREPTNKGGCMHIDTDKVNPRSFGTYLNRAGYTVGYFGKHMNDCPQVRSIVSQPDQATTTSPNA